jgi:DNA polymerase epsilon subunit 2
VAVKSSIIDKEPVHRVVSLLLEAEAAAADESPDSVGGSSASAIRVIDAFLIPKFRYDPIKKIFHEYVDSLIHWIC